MSEQAVLGGGCFWCLEAVFQRRQGVIGVASGYAGGHPERPSYKEVCSGKTGHAEVISIIFDTERVTFEELLELFWRSHDPTTLNRQGADTGTQYRSIILTTNEDQAETAAASIGEAQKHFSSKIVTEVKPLERFWEAEPEHRNFYNNDPNHPYCQMNILPKLKKLQL